MEPSAAFATRSRDHTVAFYETEAYLTNAVVGFLAPALADGKGALVIASPPHRRRFEEALRRPDLGLGAACDEGRLVLLDADETFSRLMADGAPHPTVFNSIAGEQLEALYAWGSTPRIFGEMVSLLWDRGNIAGALALEELWNGLLTTHEFELLCAYPMASFRGTENDATFHDLCQRHTAIANEAYAGIRGLEDEAPATVVLEREDGRLRVRTDIAAAERETDPGS